MAGEHPTATVLAQRFSALADLPGVLADVAALAGSPRGRRHHAIEMERAEKYVTARLSEVGWTVTAKPFERRWVIGVSEAGGSSSILRRLRLYPRLRGVNLLAELPAPASSSASNTAAGARHVLLIAHLDTVANSPGADDNASGVAALIECARLLATLPEPPAVRLAVVDLEELGKVGSGALARDRAYRREVEAVICLESVGTFSAEPQWQHLGGLGLLFREVARRVRANQNRGDFLLAICRSSTFPAARLLAEAGAALVTPLSVLVARDPRTDGWRGLLATGLFPFLANLDRSDHAPFWNHGVPALMLTTTAPFRNRNYHQPGDRPVELDYPRLTALAAVVAAVAASWPRSPSPISAADRPR